MGYRGIRSQILAFFISFFLVYFTLTTLVLRDEPQSEVAKTVRLQRHTVPSLKSSIPAQVKEVFVSKKVTVLSDPLGQGVPDLLPSFCPHVVGTYRGVVNPADLVNSLGFFNGAFQHALPDSTCLKYIIVKQNHEAGAGHRLRQWSTALWLAMSLPRRTAAFAHTTLDEGEGKHGGYPGE